MTSHASHAGPSASTKRSHENNGAPSLEGASLDVSLWLRLLASHNLMLAELRKKLADDVTMPRFDLLAALDRDDGQTPAELSRRLLVTAGNLTGLVDRAVRDGVVLRRTDPKDKRLSRVYLTKKGRALICEVLPRHATFVRGLVSGLGVDDRRDLRRLLGVLRDSLEHEKPEKAERNGASK